MSAGVIWLCVLSCAITYVSAGEREKRQVVNPTCDQLNPCFFGSFCYNGGTCKRNMATCGVYCICRPGFAGTSCDECETDPCAVNSTCQNGGTCLSNKACEPKCSCPSGFTGDLCETPVSSTTMTVTSPSTNETSSPSTNQTSAPSNTTGAECVWDMCLYNNPCNHAGTCADCGESCICATAYTGRFCETPLSSPPKADTTVGSTRKTPTICKSGYICFHGDCVTTSDGTRCECDKGFTGQFCDWPCNLDCGDNGECARLDISSPEFCNCIFTHTGDTCAEVIQRKTIVTVAGNWKAWLIGSVVVVLVVLGLLVLVAYVLMKKRNIFIMRVLYYFQPHEDDDGKEFDAFVSYKSSPEDETFVYKTLYQELEKQRSFKLCLHQRDFVPGETIANNILWAIEKSRRTILVLSPNYMESDFTRFEYQVAHNEMLKQKHKVIPLLLEDISQQKHLTDRTLSSILKSITYIEWPQNGDESTLKAFWRRLELSMPKIKSRSIEDGGTDTTTSRQISYANSAFESCQEPTDLMGAEEKPEKNVLKIQDNLQSQQVPTKDDFEGIELVVETDDRKNPSSVKNLKAFFAEPSNDDLFNAMRESSEKLEKTLEV
ncbi:low-density lipoprotein receptor-related protein 1-like isoform X1 [Haliotis rubra]|uniref:low-density lipoprotein receptor-related protein 1-like isoform X1 n=2 Tax=Haliotis rubra TaxID=36100 RepID=UPI001EE5E75A|nr:low-density lipoprotein receptor-related protein 1-like isoform X1 [Haliotis rubra]